MEYIVFDLEFNQGFDRKLNKTVSNEKCPFEIIQIGAVKLDYNFNIIDTFNTFVKPNIYKDIHPFIKKMTGITNEDVKKLLKYRFKNGSLENHAVKNFLLAAMYDIKGNLTDAVEVLCNLLDIKGTILPISDDVIEIVGHYDDGKKIVGEEQITKNGEPIKELTYNKKIKVNKKVFTAIDEADLIIFSPGSLYTSVLPHLIIPSVAERINNSKAKTMYVCNLFTQPGETDNFGVSDHLKVLEKYVRVDAVIANNAKLPRKELKTYMTKEQKDQVKLDTKKVKEMGTLLISDDIFTLEDNIIRHDALKTAYLIFSYLMRSDNK